MREIKFRAWLKEDDKMVFNKQATAIPLFTNNWAYTMNDIELMQYTGLKDKNGLTEIYEGDIVKSSNGKLLRVVFRDGAFRLARPQERIKIIGNIFPSNTKFEVIGNIYENKDLLNGKQ